MKTLSRLNPKESALTILVIVSQIFVVNDRVIAQSIPRISIPGLATPVIPVITPNVAIPTVNVTTTNNIPSTSLINSPTPVIPTVNVTFNNKGVPIFANYNGTDISTNIPSILDLKPLTFSVTGSEDNPSSFLSVINNNGTPTETTGVVNTSTPTSITIPQPTPVDGELVTVSTVNVVFPSSQTATGITSSFNNSFGDISNPFTIQSSTLTVNFTPPVLD